MAGAPVPSPPSECTADIRASVAWGAGSSAFQIEGGWNASGKGPSVWDAELMNEAGPFRIKTSKWGFDGTVAVDFYNRFRQDIALMKSLGLKHYR